MQFVATFEEACAVLKIGTEIPDVTAWPGRLQRHLTALYKLDAILTVNNGGWKADLSDIDQKKYYPWFGIIRVPSGFGLSYGGFAYDLSLSDLGARLACCSPELAEYMGNTFADLYKDLHI